VTLRDLMTDDDKQREDDWSRAKWDSMVRYVRRLSSADKLKWANRQTEKTKDRMREAIREANLQD
jgi:hypothetical protein